ncbi:ornithine cyclodeaminase family protein [Stenotrophomonas rhizophila]|nr:ornithine cyclodeaminase family protein [Stenotrophomonas rhizophila]MCC7663025.1 ornithine cyclodeaminase family protein [Stenotrophomonas rhizophila]
MKVVDLPDIRAALDLDAAFEAVRQGFIAHFQGRVSLGAVSHLALPAVSGDCHVKTASMHGQDCFVVKVATGFPHNAAQGRPTSNGMMVLLDANTGVPRCLLRDAGWLTDMRTAMAGALAAELLRPTEGDTLGIVGTGVQGALQARLAAHRGGFSTLLIWGRRYPQAQQLAAELCAEGIRARALPSLDDLARASDVLITTTPTSTPLLQAGMFERRVRIVAVGADSPGKQELTTTLTAAMDILIADSIDQCLDHGELASAFALGHIKRSQVTAFGQYLAEATAIPNAQSVLVDLTGLGIQDLQIALTIWNNLPGRDPGDA